MAQKKLTHILDSCQALVPIKTVRLFLSDVCCLKMLIPDHGCLVEIPGKKGHIVKCIKAEVNVTYK